jgi:ribosome maturation protein Sdo1
MANTLPRDNQPIAVGDRVLIDSEFAAVNFSEGGKPDLHEIIAIEVITRNTRTGAIGKASRNHLHKVNLPRKA